MVLKVRVSGLDIQQGHPLVLVATLPAVHHLWGRRPWGSGPCKRGLAAHQSQWGGLRAEPGSGFPGESRADPPLLAPSYLQVSHVRE